MQRALRFVTPATRAKICRAVYDGVKHRWHGSRAGIAMRIDLDPQPDLDGRRVHWRARLRGKWSKGIASTVTEALDQIERKAGSEE